MSQAYLVYFSGKGEPPTPQQIEDAWRKRALADDLFSVSLSRWREAGRGPLE